MQDRFRTNEMTKEEILDSLTELKSKNQDDLTTTEVMRIKIVSHDSYLRQMLQDAKDPQIINDMVNEIISNIDSIDLKSFDFSKDKDLSYKP